MSMSAEVKYTRGELFCKAYRENKPELAKKFLGKKYSSASELADLGGVFLASSIIGSAIFLGVFGGVTNGFGPVPGDFCFAFVAIGIGCGLFAIPGLIMLAIGYCKKRDILAEPLSETDVIEITGTPLKEGL